MFKQYLMKVYPVGRGREVYRNIKICGDDTLNALCQVILKSFGFTDDHLYEFCMDNKMYSKHSYQSAPQGNEPSTDIKLDELELYEGQKFSLHYDFGADWMFAIRVAGISDVIAKIEPRIIKSKGSVMQYPDWF